jgi:AraC-like DNA-binding protein
VDSHRQPRLLVSQRSSAVLRPFVRAYAQRMMFVDAPPQAFPPRLEPGLGFEFGLPIEIHSEGRPVVVSPRIALVGGHARPGTQLLLKRGVESFCVFFRPAGIAQLFGVPMALLTNSYADGAAVMGRKSAELLDRMAGAKTFSARVAIVERFLIGLLPTASRNLMIDASTAIFRTRGTTSMERVASAFGVSLRQFERRFSQEVGMPPKLFARIARFQTAVDWKTSHPDLTWRHIAHQLGYHDQMHLIHDFGKIGGDTPGQLITSLGDSRPPALANRQPGP